MARTVECIAKLLSGQKSLSGHRIYLRIRPMSTNSQVTQRLAGHLGSTPAQFSGTRYLRFREIVLVVVVAPEQLNDPYRLGCTV